MAKPTAEFRETLVEKGCSEAMAEAIVELAGAARDEAVEQAAERNGHSISILTTRFESHEKQNEADLRSVESTIRETVANATTEIKEELAKERILNERRFSEVRSEIAELGKETEQRFSEVERRFSEVERRFSEVHSEIAKQGKENERRFSEVMSEIVGLRADFERRMGEMRGELEHRMLVLGVGMAGLVLGATGAIIGAMAAFSG